MFVKLNIQFVKWVSDKKNFKNCHKSIVTMITWQLCLCIIILFKLHLCSLSFFQVYLPTLMVFNNRITVFFFSEKFNWRWYSAYANVYIDAHFISYTV